MTPQPAEGSPGPEEGVALLAAVGTILDAVVDDIGGAFEAVAEVCVPAFADLCAVELIGPHEEVRTVVCRAPPGTGLRPPEGGIEVGRGVAGSESAVLAAGDARESSSARAARERLGAGSLLVAPMMAGGRSLGWLVAATGAHRPALGEPDVQVARALSSRLGSTVRQVQLYRQLQASADEQSRLAHDFNNLLTLITGYSDLLGRGMTDPHLRALAGEIEDAARRGAGLTQEMLEASAWTSPEGVTEPDGAAGDLIAPDEEVWPPGRTLRGRILYVEDEPGLRLAGQETLADVGLDVVTADSAEMALSILAGDPSFDALVTDIALPGLSGVQLTRAVRPTHPHLRVLYVTGYSGAPDPDHTPGPGEPVLRKPYRSDSLRLRVAELLEGPDGGRVSAGQGS
jgi:CheY-like chemotaxis protein